MCEETLIFRPFCGSILEVSYCNILISKFFLQLSQVVGMKVLERPLEKLDEVRKKKLIEIIGVESTAPATAAPGLYFS
jgi:hypothetical protein